MKTRAITELFKQAALPVALLDEGEPEWHNEAFARLERKLRQQLINWAAAARSNSRCQRGGFTFELLTANRHRLLIANACTPIDLSRQLLRQLLPALAAGGDPWLNTATVLGPLLGWEHCAAVKHKSASADELLGHWHEGELRAPKQLPLDGTLGAHLYTAPESQLLLEAPAATFKDEPLLVTDHPALWLAQRVESEPGAPLGYLCTWGKPQSGELSRAMQLLPLAGELLALHLGQKTAEEKDDPVLTRFPTDELTGLPGRAAFDATLEAFEDHYRVRGQNCQMAMLDINGLSALNQNFGFPFGDKVLRRFAKQLSHLGRTEDRIFRFGGDEFVLLMPFEETPPPLRQRLKEVETRLREQLGIEGFSVGAGLACLSETNGSSDDLMLLTDRRLRESKAQRH